MVAFLINPGRTHLSQEAVTLKPGCRRKGAEQEMCQEAEAVHPVTGPLRRPVSRAPPCCPQTPVGPDECPLPPQTWLLTHSELLAPTPWSWLCPGPSGFCLYWNPGLSLWAVTGCPWLCPVCCLWQEPCPSSSSMGLDTGHLASALARPALTPRGAVGDLSRDNRIEQAVYRSSSV